MASEELLSEILQRTEFNEKQILSAMNSLLPPLPPLRRDHCHGHVPVYTGVILSIRHVDALS